MKDGTRKASSTVQYVHLAVPEMCHQLDSTFKTVPLKRHQLYGTLKIVSEMRNQLYNK